MIQPRVFLSYREMCWLLYWKIEWALCCLLSLWAGCTACHEISISVSDNLNQNLFFNTGQVRKNRVVALSLVLFEEALLRKLEMV